MKKTASALAVAMALSGCTSQAVNEIGRAPSMSPIGSGLNYAETPQMAMYPKQPRTAVSGYSIWSDQQSALFKDSRAFKVGDIMTVNIRVNDKASFDNKTDRSRTNKSGMNLGFGGSGNNFSVDTSADLNYGSSTSTKGDGAIREAEPARRRRRHRRHRERQSPDFRLAGSAREP